MCLSCCYSLSPPYALSPQTFLYECYLFRVEINKKMFQKSGNQGALEELQRRKDPCFAFLLDRVLGVLVGDVTGQQMEASVPQITPLTPVTAQLSPQGCTLRMALFTTISKATGCVGQITPLRKAGHTSYCPIYQLMKERAL